MRPPRLKLSPKYYGSKGSHNRDTSRNWTQRTNIRKLFLYFWYFNNIVTGALPHGNLWKSQNLWTKARLFLVILVWTSNCTTLDERIHWFTLLCDTTFVQLDTNRLKKVVQRGGVKHSLKNWSYSLSVVYFTSNMKLLVKRTVFPRIMTTPRKIAPHFPPPPTNLEFTNALE